MKSEKEDGNGERSIVNSKMIKEVQEQELERKKDQEPVCRQGRHEQESGRKIRQKDPPKRSAKKMADRCRTGRQICIGD
jgi:hypothetical protein